MIWSDYDIKRSIEKQDITIEPYDPHLVQPASYDLRLGNIFWIFDESLNNLNNLKVEFPHIDPRKDIKELMLRREVVNGAFYLFPQKFALGMTMEKLSLSDKVVARIEGKSSIGRMGLTVHSTAGFIDPGNQDLNITLELFNQSPLPIKLYPGMKICQLAFQYLLTPCDVPYGHPSRKSRYFANNEPVPSKVNENL